MEEKHKDRYLKKKGLVRHNADSTALFHSISSGT